MRTTAGGCIATILGWSLVRHLDNPVGWHGPRLLVRRPIWLEALPGLIRGARGSLFDWIGSVRDKPRVDSLQPLGGR